jgi:predicted heme/steroid binding protein
MREFTEKELAYYNGKNGKPAYVACNGKVFDVSTSFLWKDGNHQVLHKAGMDLTTALQQAPHDEKVLEKFPIVGTLRNTEKPMMPP